MKIELSEYKEYAESRGAIPKNTPYRNLEAGIIETHTHDLPVFGKDGELTLRDCTRIEFI